MPDTPPKPAAAAPRRALLALPLLATSARAADGTLETVMTALAAVRRSEARFEESKSIAGLADTLPSSGILRWEAPSTLEKRVLEPFSERVTLSGSRLVYEREGRDRQEIDLSQAPEVRALVEAIRSTLAGDLPTLRQHYAVALDGTPAGWTLRLSPLSVRVRAVVQAVIVEGRNGTITRFETVGNESSVMRITPGG